MEDVALTCHSSGYSKTLEWLTLRGVTTIGHCAALNYEIIDEAPGQLAYHLMCIMAICKGLLSRDPLNADIRKCFKTLDIDESVPLKAFMRGDAEMMEELQLQKFPRILCEYKCRLSRSPSWTYLIMYEGDIPEACPSMTSDGLPITFMRPKLESVDLSQPIEPCSSQDLHQVIANYYEHLFRLHSNLISIRGSFCAGKEIIRMGVTCKDFIPFGETTLPKFLDGYPVKVEEVRFKLTTITDMKKHCCRPIRAGIAIAPQSLSNIDLEGPNNHTIGTLGGFFRHEDAVYGVTVGYLMRSGPTSRTLLTSQPVMNTAGYAQLLDFFDFHRELRNYMEHTCHMSEKAAMAKILKRIDSSKSLDAFVDEINNSSEILPIGTTVGALFGNIDGSSLCSDVALIRISPDVTVDDTSEFQKSYDDELRRLIRGSLKRLTFEISITSTLTMDRPLTYTRAAPCQRMKSWV